MLHRYAENLARLTHPGSLFLLYAFEHHTPLGIGISQAEVAELFSHDFALEQTKQGNYLGGRAAFCYVLKKRHS